MPKAKILTKEEWRKQDLLMQATSHFAFEILQLKKDKNVVVDELIERGKELQTCCRKIAKAGGKATQVGSKKMYVVRGSFDQELYDPKIGSFETKETRAEHVVNPALADELEKIYKLTYGYFGTKLTQLSSQFEITCKRFWILDQTQPMEGEENDS